MLGMLIPNAMPNAPSAWKIWVEHIMKQKKTLGFKKAAMAYTNGTTVAATSGHILPVHEIQKFKLYFEDVEKCPESIVIQGKTYVLKSINERILVAFNGMKYYIIARSRTMYIITMCECRAKVDSAAAWIGKINTRLIEKNF